MFDFLENWDPILVDFKKDIDGVIKGEIRLWSVAMQTYCERLMKLFNSKEKIYLDEEKITFGTCINDTYFKNIFQEKTGFRDFNSLRRLNEFGNKRKHQESHDNIEKEEIKEWLKRIHTLSLKTFNYINNQNYYEKFDEDKVDKLLLSSEEEFFDVIEYADNMISRKNSVILKLEQEYLELESIIHDDTEEIISYKNLIKRIEEESQQYKDLSLDYISLLDKVEEYLDKNRIKNHCIDEILEIHDIYGYKIEGKLEILINQFQTLRKELKKQHRDIEKYIYAEKETCVNITGAPYFNNKRDYGEPYGSYNVDDENVEFVDDYEDRY